MPGGKNVKVLQHSIFFYIESELSSPVMVLRNSLRIGYTKEHVYSLFVIGFIVGPNAKTFNSPMFTVHNNIILVSELGCCRLEVHRKKEYRYPDQNARF